MPTLIDNLIDSAHRTADDHAAAALRVAVEEIKRMAADREAMLARYHRLCDLVATVEAQTKGGA